MIRIYLNSAVSTTTPIDAPSLWFDVTEFSQGIEDLEMTFSRKDSVVQRAITNTITFDSLAYDFIYNNLVGNLANEHIWVKIEIDGFAYVFPYLQIRWNSINWCTTKCEIEAKLTTWNEDLDRYKLLKSVLVWDEAFLLNLNYLNQWTGANEEAHPMMRVRWEEGGAAQDSKWNWAIVGVYLRHYFYNICDKAGLIPSSSIFSYDDLNGWTGDDYNDTNYVNNANYYQNINLPQPKRNPYHYSAAFLNTGITDTKQELDYLRTTNANRTSPKDINNALNLNGIQYMDNIGSVFNSRYRIRNGELEFERKDYFYQTAIEWQDFSDEDMCLKLKAQENWAYLRLEYGEESSLWENALIERGALNYNQYQSISTVPPFPIFPEKYYNEIVEWNANPTTTRQEGELSRVLPFGKLRTKTNGTIRDNATDKYGFQVWSMGVQEPILCCLREDSPMNRKNIYDSFEAVQGSYSLFLNRPFFTKKQSVATLDNGIDYDVQWEGTLYDNFHFIDDPRRRPNNRGFEAKEPYKSFEYEINVDFNCEMLSTFDIDNSITTKQGKAIMEEVRFSFKDRNLNIKGFV